MGARVLIVGGGGREHALAWRLERSPSVSEVLCAPGNPGIALDARCLAVAADDVPGLCALAERERVDLVVVGPEVALCAGLVDALTERGILAFGPLARAAELEGSKAFCKLILDRAGVPTARFAIAQDIDSAIRFIRSQSRPLVVKADGLAAGKGVVVCHDAEEACSAARRMLEGRAFGEAGARLVIEERLEGYEASLMAIVDGERIVMLPAAEDHKAVYDGDRGPNTGGMGAYCPSQRVDPALLEQVKQQVMSKVVRAMAEAGRPYRGVLYAGLMLTPDRGPMVLEFNCRFGDPETQVLMARFADDLYPWLAGAAAGKLPPGAPRMDPRPAVCVVQCASGYPGPHRKGDLIEGLDAPWPEDVMIFHAGTARTNEGRWTTAGGRVLGTTALGADLAAARARAYEAVSRIRWEGEHHRNDIAARPR